MRDSCWLPQPVNWLGITARHATEQDAAPILAPTQYRSNNDDVSQLQSDPLGYSGPYSEISGNPKPWW